MSCCLENLGDLPHNKDLNTGLIASQGGEHTAVLFFAGVRIKRKFSVLIGGDIKIPKPFNESYQYSLQIIQPDGTLYTKNDCENFAFKTYVSIEDPCGECVECEPFNYN